MLNNAIHAAELASSVQTFKARVELYNGSTLVKVCNCGETLIDFTIERSGASKFFGFGICQKLTATLMDDLKELNIVKDYRIEVSFGVGCNFIYPYPAFYVEDAPRDAETNEITITAYDALYKADSHTVSEVSEYPINYTLETHLATFAQVLDLPINISAVPGDSFSREFPATGNFEGTETIREALDAIAEATQSIYYINNNWELTFKRLDKDGAAVFTIDRSNYFELLCNGAETLGAIIHTTQLEDSITAIEPEDADEGATQYVRDNQFWDLREDIAELVDAAQAAIGGITIEQFECDWFGNYLLEIGDKIKLITKDNTEHYTYLLDDTLTFNGAIEQRTSWHYEEDEAESATNLTSLGEALTQTYARIDKANHRIDIVASESSASSNRIAALEFTTGGITSRVERVEAAATEQGEQIESLRTEITQSAEQVKIAIRSEFADIGSEAESITTETGFTFNADGLNITKDGSEISTLISEDGMTVSKNGEQMLEANNQGVTATDLHARTYLIINGNSRFENYTSIYDGSARTGCFWIGG